MGTQESLVSVQVSRCFAEVSVHVFLLTKDTALDGGEEKKKK